jgi:hypothetical protein
MTNYVRLLSGIVLLLLPVTLHSNPIPQSAADVNVSGSLTPDKTKKGRTIKGSVVMEIPSGLHVQSNKPLDKFLIPTKLDLETPSGLRVGPISYPRAVMRNLKFSKGAVAVYEGRATMRFSVMVPANYNGGVRRDQGQSSLPGVQ